MAIKTLNMFAYYFAQSFCNPAVQTHSFAGSISSNALVQFRRNTHVKASRVRLFSRFSLLVAKVQIVFNRIFKGFTKFATGIGLHGAPLKGDYIGKVYNFAVKNIRLRVVVKAALIAFIFKYVHSFLSANGMALRVLLNRFIQGVYQPTIKTFTLGTGVQGKFRVVTEGSLEEVIARLKKPKSPKFIIIDSFQVAGWDYPQAVELLRLFAVARTVNAGMFADVAPGPALGEVIRKARVAAIAAGRQ